MNEPEPLPLTRADFERASCDVPWCTARHERDPIFLRARCHLSAGLRVEYLPGGVLRMTCRECRSQVALVAVADPAKGYR